MVKDNHKISIDIFIFLLSACLGTAIIYGSANTPPGWLSDFLLNAGTGIITIGFTVVLVDMVRKNNTDSHNWNMLTSAYAGMVIRGDGLLFKLMNLTHPNTIDRFNIKKMKLNLSDFEKDILYPKTRDLVRKSRKTVYQLRTTDFVAPLEGLTVSEVESLNSEFEMALDRIDKINDKYAVAFSDPHIRNLFVNLAAFNRGVVAMLSVRVFNLNGRKGIESVPVVDIADMINMYLATYDEILEDYLKREQSLEKQDKLKKIINKLIGV